MCSEYTNRVIIYCDGACSGNQYKVNYGGWGAVLLFNGHETKINGYAENTTNQRMELLACINAIESIKTPGYQIDVYSDSAYLVNGMSTGKKILLLKIKRKKNIKNLDLWHRLLDLDKRYNITFRWVKGHGTDELNIAADALARQAIRSNRPDVKNSKLFVANSKAV